MSNRASHGPVNIQTVTLAEESEATFGAHRHRMSQECAMRREIVMLVARHALHCGGQPVLQAVPKAKTTADPWSGRAVLSGDAAAAAAASSLSAELLPFTNLSLALYCLRQL